MQIRLIIAQHKCDYPGQFMPNVVDAWDEYTLEDNWQGYEEALRKYTDLVGTAYESVRELIVTIPDRSVTDLFDNQIPTVEGQV